jgi:hypothetical protein
MLAKVPRVVRSLWHGSIAPTVRLSAMWSAARNRAGSPGTGWARFQRYFPARAPGSLVTASPPPNLTGGRKRDCRIGKRRTAQF